MWPIFGGFNLEENTATLLISVDVHFPKMDVKIAHPPPAVRIKALRANHIPMTTRRQRKSSFESLPRFLLPPAPSFASILDLRLLHRLPLHVRRNISAAAFKGNDVIDDVTLPPSRVACPPHELTSCRGAPLDPAVAVPFGDRRFLRY